MDELIYYSHRKVYTNQTICWDPIETERGEATIPCEAKVTRSARNPGVHLLRVLEISHPWCTEDSPQLKLQLTIDK